MAKRESVLETRVSFSSRVMPEPSQKWMRRMPRSSLRVVRAYFMRVWSTYTTAPVLTLEAGLVALGLLVVSLVVGTGTH